MKKKKILIAYATYGSGHKTVAEYVYEYLIKNNIKDELDIRIIDILDYSNKLGDLTKNIFEKSFQLKGNFIFNTIYELFDHRLTTINYKFLTRTLFSKELEDYIIDFEPDIMISSHFFASIMMEIINQKYNIKTKIVTIITDYQSHQMWIKNKNKSTAYIVSNEIVKQQLINDGIKKEKIYPFGIPLSNNFRNVVCDIDVVKNNYNVNNNLSTYLFFAGGGMGASYSYDYFKKILELKLDINMIFVCGKNEKLKNRAEYLVKNRNYKNVLVLGYTNDVFNLMNISDLVITKPGALILTESLEMRKPLLLIPGAGGQENYNAKFIKRNGFGINCCNPRKTGKYVKKIYDNPKILEKYKYNLMNYEKNKSIDKIHKLVINLLKEEDCKE